MKPENECGARNAHPPSASMLAAHTSVAATRTRWRRRTGGHSTCSIDSRVIWFWKVGNSSGDWAM
jgi:hypothetical protein